MTENKSIEGRIQYFEQRLIAYSNMKVTKDPSLLRIINHNLQKDVKSIIDFYKEVQNLRGSYVSDYLNKIDHFKISYKMLISETENNFTKLMNPEKIYSITWKGDRDQLELMVDELAKKELELLRFPDKEAFINALIAGIPLPLETRAKSEAYSVIKYLFQELDINDLVTFKGSKYEAMTKYFLSKTGKEIKEATIRNTPLDEENKKFKLYKTNIDPIIHKIL